MSRNKNKGFTLVEILIVVVILGILAAIVIPQFTNASESAKASSLVSQLQTIRSQFELYQVQHNGNYPVSDSTAAHGLWTCLTTKTKIDGTAASATDTVTFGPYLQQEPKNPFTGGSTIGTDWTYDATTHVIKAMLPSGVTLAGTGLTSADAVEASAK
jgi:general secretion pathway protein G